MKYRSTRGGMSGVKFCDAVMMGMAPDGGLFVPEEIPKVDAATLQEWKKLSFAELAAEIISLYISKEEISKAEILELTKGAYGTFRSPDVTPVVPLEGDVHLLELFHGPTWAFKDVALQFLGRLFELILKKRGGNAKLTIIGATSGDTGSSAIAGVRGRQGVHCFILYPLGRTSKIQEAQMCSVPDENVHALALKDAFFDDCQKIVKDLFADTAFRTKHSLGAVNSINWARIVAQITYYFYTALRLADKAEAAPAFSVPTGNFGDILAGWYAKQMGCPCRALLVATNANDILARFFATGKYERPPSAQETVAPSMDICVSSNFERFIYHCGGDNPAKLAKLMRDFEQTGSFSADDALHRRARAEMIADSVLEPAILETIKRWHAKTGYVLDPHTACGVAAATNKAAYLARGPVVCLACAHHAKFPDAVKKAIGDDEFAKLPTESRLVDLLAKPQRRVILGKTRKDVVDFVEQHVPAPRPSCALL